MRKICSVILLLQAINMLVSGEQLGVCVVTHMALVVRYQLNNVIHHVRWDQEHVVGCLGVQSTKQLLQLDPIWDVLSTLRIEIYLC